MARILKFRLSHATIELHVVKELIDAKYGECWGWYDDDERRIIIVQEALDTGRKVEIFFHELTHAALKIVSPAVDAEALCDMIGSMIAQVLQQKELRKWLMN